MRGLWFVAGVMFDSYVYICWGLKALWNRVKFGG